ncbi:uncharacterized protein G2W53_033462 [Senna tora]|uniref:Uncharacterized protein n=1 Tax=Senna tora TaxID=362788 RepID=A0A834SZB0_9FABA|nr:uncharacterized protein G2W53_033462 [Senna tora]
MNHLQQHRHRSSWKHTCASMSCSALVASSSSLYRPHLASPFRCRTAESSAICHFDVVSEVQVAILRASSKPASISMASSLYVRHDNLGYQVCNGKPIT